MNANTLSQRLQAVADYVVKYAQKPCRLADIGSDHAYLPAYLALKSQLAFAIAGEVVDGPYQSAIKQVEELQLESLIAVRKGDGLEVIQAEDAINTITICGMGGGLIRDILHRGAHKIMPGCLLLLQANTGEHLVRRHLNQHKAEIIDEAIVYEQGHYYEIIVAKQRDYPLPPLSARELLLGPIQIQKKSPEFFAKWERALAHRQNILKSIQASQQLDSDKIQNLNAEIQLIQEEIHRHE